MAWSVQSQPSFRSACCGDILLRAGNQLTSCTASRCFADAFVSSRPAAHIAQPLVRPCLATVLVRLPLWGRQARSRHADEVAATRLTGTMTASSIAHVCLSGVLCLGASAAVRQRRPHRARRVQGIKDQSSSGGACEISPQQHCQGTGGLTLTGAPGTTLLDPDPDLYEELLDRKVRRVKAFLGDRLRVPLEIVPSKPLHHRMKVSFSLGHTGDSVQFLVQDVVTQRSVVLDGFPVACERIEQLMAELPLVLHEFPELRREASRTEIVTNTSGDALVSLMYKRPLQEEVFFPDAEKLAKRLGVSAGVVGKSYKKRLVAGGPGYLVQEHEVFGRVYPQIHREQMFSQSNADICAAMLRWAAACTQPGACLDSGGVEAVDGSGDLLEMHCGNGSFTLPLAANFRRVLATEKNEVPTRYARQSAWEAGVQNLTFLPLTSKGTRNALNGCRQARRLTNAGLDLDALDIRTLLVNPPRQGLDTAALRVVRMFPRCLYVSCCPESLAADLAKLPEYEVASAAFFDQFPFTEHAEVAVALRRKVVDGL